MPTVYDLKPGFQKWLRPITGFLHRNQITPNQVTAGALFGSMLVGSVLCVTLPERRWLMLLPGWLFLRMALNAIDGMLARDYQMQSLRGAVLNEGGDVVSDMSLYLPLVLMNRDVEVWVVMFTIGAVLTEFCGVLSLALGASRRYDGPMGKSDRAFWVGLLALITVFKADLVVYWGWIFGAGFAAALLTCANRLAPLWKEVSHD